MTYGFATKIPQACPADSLCFQAKTGSPRGMQAGRAPLRPLARKPERSAAQGCGILNANTAAQGCGFLTHFSAHIPTRNTEAAHAHASLHAGGASFRVVQSHLDALSIPSLQTECSSTITYSRNPFRPSQSIRSSSTRIRKNLQRISDDAESRTQ